MLSLAGKGALVIGTKRVGQLVTRRLAKEAANLAIVYRSSRSKQIGCTKRSRLK